MLKSSEQRKSAIVAADAVVAAKLQIVERGGDTVPVGHGGGVDAPHLRPGGHQHIAAAHGPADQDNFELNRSTDGKLLGRKKVDTGRADVSRDQGDRKFFWNTC